MICCLNLCLRYLSHSERHSTLTALNEVLFEDDRDKLMELTGHIGVATIPTKDNLGLIMLRVTQKQKIQPAKYAKENVSELSQQIT